MLDDSKRKYFSSKIKQHEGNSKELFRLTKSMMGYSGNTMLPLHSSLKELSQRFNIFFYDKINDIRTTLQADSDSRGESASSQLYLRETPSIK